MAEVIYPNWEKRATGAESTSRLQTSSQTSTKTDHLLRRHDPEESPQKINGETADPNSAVVSDRFEKSRGARASGLLERTIEAEIIPRLMLAHSERDPAILDGVHGGRPMSEAVSEQFCEDVMTQGTERLATIVEALYRGGMPLKEIYLHLLGPAAAHAGHLWKEDKVSFVDVTLALNRLHQVVHRLRALLPPVPTTEDANRILLTTLPGDQHSFGVTLLTDLFRQAGWTVYEASGDTANSLCARISSEWFDCVGLSVSNALTVDTVAPLVSRMRDASSNRDLKIIAGGHMLEDKAEMAQMLDVDAIVCDPDRAIATAERCVNQMERLTE
ncbi:MAG: cobalamin-dependent protein [Alphaproteobacteria bacterium]|nr:cobalamin-dependent protein [Alphaproteobacteria bacterium]